MTTMAKAAKAKAKAAKDFKDAAAPGGEMMTRKKETDMEDALVPGKRRKRIRKLRHPDFARAAS